MIVVRQMGVGMVAVNPSCIESYFFDELGKNSVAAYHFHMASGKVIKTKMEDGEKIVRAIIGSNQ